jgi:hypothetical protein
MQKDDLKGIAIAHSGIGSSTDSGAGRSGRCVLAANLRVEQGVRVDWTNWEGETPVKEYLEATRHAAEGLINLYAHDLVPFYAARNDMIESIAKVGEWSKDATQRNPLSDEFFDELVNRIRPLQKRALTSRDRAIEHLDIIEARVSSLAALAGAILQIAKQGISTIYGLSWKTDCPTGRMIGSQNLRTVIWEGRNHSMHYEEGNPSVGVKNCFLGLETSFGQEFSLSVHPSANRSVLVVTILGWLNYDAYEQDMLSLSRQ